MHWGRMVGAQDSGLNCLVLNAGVVLLCCVLGQCTLLSQDFSPPTSTTVSTEGGKGFMRDVG